MFDYKVLRWETSYFLERFIMRVCGIYENYDSLKEEFHKLATEVDGYPKRIMHRDFQSGNVMIKSGVPYLIDFQGAHWGPPVFDLVSILKDPYISYPQEVVERLKVKYLNKLSEQLKLPMDALDRAYTLCGMQRHMQALGAYGFITHIRGKDFLHHCPSAYKLLCEEVESVKDEFSILWDLLKRIKGTF